MTEPKPLPSETKLVERGVKMLTEDHLAKAICLYNGIALVGDDGSEQWWPFCSDAKRMLANADGELKSALASLADELRLAQTELKGCYRLIDELKEELRLAREEQIALLRFVEHPVTPEMWKAMFAKEPR